MPRGPCLDGPFALNVSIYIRDPKPAGLPSLGDDAHRRCATPNAGRFRCLCPIGQRAVVAVGGVVINERGAIRFAVLAVSQQIVLLEFSYPLVQALHDVRTV